jgi:flavin-dependent dehydrogenase
MSSPAFDVAVVGAGPAGLAAALAAAESGVTVALIDAGGPPRRTVLAIAGARSGRIHATHAAP